MTKRDYYEVLGIEREADLDAVKKAYRKLALQYHPDRNPGDAKAEDHFKEVNEAYEVLQDPQKRAAYDQYGHAAVDGSGGGAGGFSGGFGFDLSDALRSFMREFGGFDFFGQEAGGGRGGDRRGGNRQIRLSLTLEEVATGVTKKIRVSKLIACQTCSGRGSSSGATESCSACGGTGQIRRVQRSFFGQMVNVSVCSRCHGEGEVVRDPCPTCGGDGRIEGQETVTVNIPAGVMEGNYMPIRGHGDAGVRGAAAGDLVVYFTEKPHAAFTRHGADVLGVLAIHPHQAVLGAKVEVPTLTGSVRIDIPPGIQSGKILRLRGRGMPGLGGHEAGDHMVRIAVVIPTKLTAEERRLYVGLARVTGDEPPKIQKGFFDRMREAFGG
jgi:molecular chaperone DnaJ